MAQGFDSTKTAARPSHEAIESDETNLLGEESKEKKLDHIAMESAKRAGNRLVGNEESTPSNSIFSK